jgi:tetratricopeptide (TPR) repeat protein
MSREAYIKTLSADQQKQLADLRKHNSEALKNNQIVKQINGDLGKVTQDIKEADGATAAAAQQLGSGATKEAIASKANDIKTQAYTDIETLMTKDTTATAGRNDVSILWARLGQGELGLKKYDAAIEDFNKDIAMDSSAKKPNPEVQGLAQSGLGEAYARTGKVDQAAAAYDAAAKANPAAAAIYLKNQAVIYFQMGNATAQVAAADKAIAVDPNNPILYYLKGQGLVGNATVDPKTNRIVLPPGCADAYQKYLQLAPNGPYAAEVQGILQQAGEKISNTYRAGKKH